MTASKAQIEANRRYESKTYDAIRLLLKKGIKDRIKATGQSVNGFITDAILEKLDRMEYVQDDAET